MAARQSGVTRRRQPEATGGPPVPSTLRFPANRVGRHQWTPARSAGPGADSAAHRERLRQVGGGAVPGVHVDAARLHDELAAVVVEAEVAVVEGEADGLFGTRA